jgi:high-affinity iron transporter
MNFSDALPSFVVTLREGVEAALVVGVVLALLKKADRSQLNSQVYAGIGLGMIVSVLIGILFTLAIKLLGAINPEYTSVVEPALAGVFSLLAIAMLSWMLIWMTKQAKLIKGTVEGAVTAALTDSNAGWGIFSLILVTVVREGFETVLFLAANFQQGFIPVLGAILGLAAATAIGLLLFKWSVKINLRQFFPVMGTLLVLIVAGLVVSSLKHFDEALANLSLDFCWNGDRQTLADSCILGPLVWDTAQILPDRQFPGIVLKSLLGYRDHLYLVEAIAYLSFLFSVGGLYLWSLTDKNPVVVLGKKFRSSR